ncbi:MAG TPA: hypothetical protein VLN49_07830 [Gemmatimonadaceae bacterium]|nr:hypothetical protein [Gemmatimonadaceae bacterium]
MSHLAFMIALVSGLSARSNAPICLAPASAQFAGTDAAQASAAVNEVFKSYLTGPSLSVVPLTARLQSQVREEARQASCKFVLFVTARQERQKRGGTLGQIAGHAAQEAVVNAGFEASTVRNRVTSVAANVAARAAMDLAATTRMHDEMELSYRLESETGAVLKEGKTKRRAKADGEDLLTPVVERSAEEIATVVTTGGR